MLIALLRENDIMGIAEISSEHYGSKTRYIFGALSPLQLACSFYKNSYLSHGTALHLHGLAPLETIFVNHEQSPKNSRPRISQAGLNRAFQNSQRQSTYVFRYGTSTITFLNGKNTQGAGIVDMQGPRGEPLKTTSLERTLIDVVVRPQYAGGMSNVLSAFRQAKDRISVAEIARLLAKVKYVYPYHQALGFILQRAGVPEEEAGAAQTACHTSQVLSRLRHESARVRPCLEALLSPRLALKCKPRVASALPGSEELPPSG